MLTVYDLRVEHEREPLGLDASKPRFSYRLKSDVRGAVQASYHIQTALDEGFTKIVWDTGEVSSARTQLIEYAGVALAACTRYYYRVKSACACGADSGWSAASWFETGLLEGSAFGGAFIAAHESVAGCPLLRRPIELKEGIVSARVYATALGMYELTINGRAVTDTVLNPGWTVYEKRLQYQTYDVTELVKAGGNVVGAMLGEGWYAGRLGWRKPDEDVKREAALLLRLVVTYEDGSSDVVVTDEQWRCAPGAVSFSGIYDGETRDERLNPTGWDGEGFDASAWLPVHTVQYDKARILARQGAFVRPMDTVKPVNILATPKGERVIDFGQNMVGYVRVRASGRAGDTVRLKHFEVLDNDGNVYLDNLRSAKQEVCYTLAGGETVLAPTFTFQGFRYVQVLEYPGDPALDAFEGVVLYSDMERTGWFDCAHEGLNQLFSNIVWGQRGNFVDVPTDCPQRDERLGWTGDAQVFARTAGFIMDTSRFFTKWLADLAADQFPDGSVPCVIPNVLGENCSPTAYGWADAAIIVPWTQYTAFGDERLLREQYPSMQKWHERVKGLSEDGVLWLKGEHYGDWLALDAKEGSYLGATPHDIGATAFFAYTTSILAQTAARLGENEDAVRYIKHFEAIRDAFNREFVTPRGRLAVSTQTAQVLALHFGLVEGEAKARAEQTLIKLIEDNKWHISTGFLGTPYICDALADIGRFDAALALLLREDYPSWLYPLSKGATTIWEHWDGIKPDGSFWSPNMNSFNHYAYGCIGEFMVRRVAGLDTLNAGYGAMAICPMPSRALPSVHVKQLTPHGPVDVAWTLEGETLCLNVEIPANTSARVTLPCVAGTIKEGGAAFEGAIKDEKGCTFTIGSGVYAFECTADEGLLPVVPEITE